MMKLSQSHRLLSQESARASRCTELHELIIEHVMNNLPDTDNRALENHERPVEMLVNALPRVRKINSVKALEMQLAFLRSLSAPVSFFHFHNFLVLFEMINKEYRNSPFLCRVYLDLLDAGADHTTALYDAEYGTRGLAHYRHLHDLMFMDDSESRLLALTKATQVLGTDPNWGTFLTSDVFPSYDNSQRLGQFIVDDELSSLIAYNPERVDEIVYFILDRGSFPGAEAMLEAIDSDSKALSSGVL